MALPDGAPVRSAGCSGSANLELSDPDATASLQLRHPPNAGKGLADEVEGPRPSRSARAFALEPRGGILGQLSEAQAT